MSKILRLFVVMISLAYSHQVLAQLDPGTAQINQASPENQVVNQDYMRKMVQLNTNVKSLENTKALQDVTYTSEIMEKNIIVKDSLKICFKLNSIFSKYRSCVEDDSTSKDCSEEEKKTLQDEFNSMCDGKGKSSCECAAALAKDNKCDLPDHCSETCELSSEDIKKIIAALEARVNGVEDEKIYLDAKAICVNSEDQTFHQQLEPKLTEEEMIKKYGSIDKYKEVMAERETNNQSEQTVSDTQVQSKSFVNSGVNSTWNSSKGLSSNPFCSCIAKKHCAVDYYCQSSCELDELSLTAVNQYKTYCERDSKNPKCAARVKAIYRKVCGSKSASRCMIDNGCYMPPDAKECSGTPLGGGNIVTGERNKTDKPDTGLTDGGVKNVPEDEPNLEGSCNSSLMGNVIPLGHSLGFLLSFTALVSLTWFRYRKVYKR